MDELINAYHDWVLAAGDWYWTVIMLPVVAITGITFTILGRGAQFRLIPAMFRTIVDPPPKDINGKTIAISSFQAFTISAASRVGVGNIAGVGTAIAVGGAGAVFWMWLMAFIGGASSMVESTLAQAYKVKDAAGFRGGPAYYIQYALKSRAGGIFFAVILIFCFPFAFSSLQANTIAATISGAAGTDARWIPWLVGGLVAGTMALVIFGGVRRIAAVTDKIVPVMALTYLIIGIVIVAMNITNVPAMIAAIFGDAFTPNAATGGAIGVVIMQGIKRGMFSNEAGLGSVPNAGATAAVTHPVKQGLVQTLGVYFDTILICSITAVIILSSNPDLANASRGISMTQNAVVSGLGPWAAWLLVVIILMLAFSSIIGNYYYGQSNVEFLSSNPVVLTIFRVLAVVAVLIGSVLSSDLVWDTADAIMGVMALTNLVAIMLLARPAFRLLRNYDQQRKAGKNPIFLKGDVQLPGTVECWNDLEEVVGGAEAARLVAEQEKQVE